MTITITQTTEALDLRPVLDLRPRAVEIAERLRAGDASAIADAASLQSEANAITDAFMSALRAHGIAEALSFDDDDHVWALVSILGTAEVDQLVSDIENMR